MKKIDLFKVNMPAGIEQQMKPILESGYISEGPFAKALEDTIQKWLGNPHVALVNSGTAALTIAMRLANVGHGDEVITSPMTCLGYKSHVLLPDGSTQHIGYIVNNKLPIHVMSLNTDTGIIEPRQVTGWVKLPSTGVNWYYVSLAHGNGRATKGHFGTRGTYVTGDHKILTTCGYKRIDQCNESDEVLTPLFKANPLQLEMINGTMLGDASIAKPVKSSHRSRLSFAHADDQNEWLNIKQSVLQGLSTNVMHRPAREGHQASSCVETKKNFQFFSLYHKWYGQKGTKKVPDDLVLTPLILATWYMDDGSLTASSGAFLSTECFESEMFWKLFYKLVALGFKPHAVRKNKGFAITLSNGHDGENSAMRFFDLIAPFVPPSMRYKIPFGLSDFNQNLWNLGPALPETSKINIEKIVAMPENQKPANVYCLEIEGNHNFIATDIVFSNCLAMNEPILSLGATPVWCDIDPKTGNIDATKIEALITPKTKAVLFVDWAGTPADLDSINTIAHAHGLKTIEDAAHAFGATYNGKKVGTVSDYTCFSFQAIKHMTTVDGGAVACSTKEDLDRAILLRWFGCKRGHNTSAVRWEGDVVEYGYKMHMADVNAVIGLESMKTIDSIVTAHRENGAYLHNKLSNSTNIELLTPATGSAQWIFTFKCQSLEHRAAVSAKLTAAGIGNSIVHTRNDAYSLFNANPPRLPMPGTDDFGARMLSVPCGWWLSQQDLDLIVETLKAA